MAPETAPPAAIAVIAEDEPIILMDLAENLTDLGFRVIEAFTAADALQALAKHPHVRLLVTDVQMPGAMDGYALAREVADRWPSMKIVVCSAFAKPQPGQMPNGARFLDKPFNVRLLTSMLRDMGAQA